MKADFIRCGCTRMNDPWRKFCGGCGRKLGPACGCGFVNAKSDHYCGGCGLNVLPRPARATDEASTRPTRATDEPSTIPIDIIEEVVS